MTRLTPAQQSALRLAYLAPDRWHDIQPQPALRRAVERLAALGRVEVDKERRRFKLAPRRDSQS